MFPSLYHGYFLLITSSWLFSESASQSLRFLGASCPVGQSLNVTSLICTNCTVGYYSNNGTSCDICAAGRYQSSKGQSSCDECVAGYYCLSGASTLTPCDAGSYSHAGSSICQSCDLGTYSGSGASNCTDCPSGSYSADSGSTSCTLCTAGKYANETGSTICDSCVMGRYQPDDGASNCTLCPAGAYGDLQGSSSVSDCIACSGGTFSSEGSSTCTSCSKGTYQADIAQSSCDDCPAGNYCPDSGATSYSTCSVDEYSLSGASVCSSCLDNTYSSAGSSSCTACDGDNVDVISRFGSEIARNSSFGVSVANIGDVDGNGVDDVAVGAPHFSDGGVRTGAVFILLLNNAGGWDSYEKISNTELSSALATGDDFGSSVAAVGDVDGDGNIDIAVGAPGVNSVGEIYIILLNSQGEFFKTYIQVGSVKLALYDGISLDEGGLFGASMTSLGDVFGDGGSNLMVGAPGDYGSMNECPNCGAIYILTISAIIGTQTGSLSAVSVIYSDDVISSDDDSTPSEDWLYGQSLVYMDQRENLTVAIGAPGINGVYITTFSSSAASSPVTFTRLSEHLLDAVDISPYGYEITSDETFGSSLAYGDVDMDGNYDLVVGDPAKANSSIYFIYYGSDENITSVRQVSTLGNASLIGSSLALLGNITADRSVDIIASTITYANIYNDSLTMFSLEDVSCPTTAPTMAPTSTPDVISALSAIYTATNGRGWENSENWNVGHPCTAEGSGVWAGVSCSNNTVVQLYLSENDLSGTLPTELGLLTTLTEFVLSNESSLKGTVPTEVGFMTSLERLSLQYTALSRPLPSEIGSLAQLSNLLLVENQFTGTTPSELAHLTKMKQFIIVNSDINGTIPAQLSNWTQATVFGFLGTVISGTIPSQLGLLTELTAFIVSKNSVTGSIPSELALLTRTAGIQLPSPAPSLAPTFVPTSRFGESSGSSDDTYNSTTFNWFIVADNLLCGEVPAEISSMSDNSVTGVDFSFFGYSYSSFDISNNYFGTPCCEVSPSVYTCSPTQTPTRVPTPSPSICVDNNPTLCPLISCSDDSSEVCSTEFCPTCTFASTCDVSCGYCSGPTPPPTKIPFPNPTLTPSHLPTIVPVPNPTLVPIPQPTFIPTPLPTLYPTPYPRPVCINSTMKLSVFGDGSGWNGERVVIERIKNGNTLILANLTLVTGNTENSVWFCSSPGRYEVTVGSIDSTTDSWMVWFLEEDEDDDEKTRILSGTSQTSQSFLLGPEGILLNPSILPTSIPSPKPTLVPTLIPTSSPTDSHRPTLLPSGVPTISPTLQPTFVPTNLPSVKPTNSPTPLPSGSPTPFPSMAPTQQCSAGEYLSGTICVDCPAGTYRGESMPNKNFTFANDCESCDLGYYSAEKASTCIKCDEGKVSSSDNTACDTCNAGTYPNNVTQTCENCPIGTYSPFPMDHCLSCDAGYYTGKDQGARTCSSCDSGFYSDGNMVNCTSCPNGTYSFSKASECVECESGKYAAGTKNSFCVLCTTSTDFGAGFHSGEGASTCNICIEGYYWGVQGKGTESKCLPCPDNAYCAGGVTEGDQFQPQPLDGYWIDRGAAAADATLASEVYACPRTSTCLKRLANITTNRRLLTSAECTLLENYDNPDCSVDEACAAGSTGPMCGSCETNYKFSAANQKCEKCSTSTTWVSAFLFIGLVGIVGAAIWTIRSGEVEIPNVLKPMFGDSIHIPILGILYNMESGTLKLLWATFQIIQSINFNLSITFPYPYSAIQRYLSFFELDFLSTDCYKSGYLLSVYLASAFPIFLAIVCWSLFGVRRFMLIAIGGNIKKLWDEHMHAFLLIIYVFVPPVANKQFRALNCQELADGQSYLRADTGINCNADSYKQFVVYDACLIFVFQCLPLLYVALLFRVRHKLNPKAPNKQLALELRDHDESLASISFLFSDYKCSRWYFEILDLYRRIFFVGVLPLIGNNQTIKTYIGCGLALLSTVYFRELTPFRVEFTNFLAVIAQYVILLAFMAALMIQSDSVSTIGISDFALGCILAIANILIVGLAIFLGWRRYRKERALAIMHKARGLKVEWATEFSDNKFQTTLSNVIARAVPTSHCLCYYYTSLKQAQLSVRVGEVPATPFGIVVSLNGPMIVRDGDPSLKLMGPLAETREAVICLSLPHALLFKYEGKKRDSPEAQNLRLVPSDVLTAMSSYHPSKRRGKKRGITIVGPASDLRSSQDMTSNAHAKGVLSLVMRGALRAYQLKDTSVCDGSLIKPSDFYRPVNPDFNVFHVVHIKTCLEYTSVMEEARDECNREGTVPLYHYTTLDVAELIIEKGFRMSTQGQGDGGLYFSTRGPSSYDIGSPTYEENIIIDCFGKERLEEYRGKHKLDVVFVYGINPKCVEQAPGGRENAKMVSKVLFEGFSDIKPDGHFYLRPDYIKAVMLIDGTTGYPTNRKEAKMELDLEISNDGKVQEQLKVMHEELKTNSDNTRQARLCLNVTVDDEDNKTLSKIPSEYRFSSASPTSKPKRRTFLRMFHTPGKNSRAQVPDEQSSGSRELDEIGIEVMNQLQSLEGGEDEDDNIIVEQIHSNSDLESNF